MRHVTNASNVLQSNTTLLQGRAAINESQVRKYSAANEAAFADCTVTKEQLEDQSAAAKKRKLQQDCRAAGRTAGRTMFKHICSGT